MNRHQHDTEHRADLPRAESVAVAETEAAMLLDLGPLPAFARLDDPSAAAALGARITWLAGRLGLQVERDGARLAIEVVRRAGLERHTTCEALPLALLALTLDRLDQPKTDLRRKIQREAHRQGLALSTSDVSYHLRAKALDAWREGRQLTRTPDGVLDLDVDSWILAAGRDMVAELTAARSDGEAEVLAELLPRFGAFLGARWRNADHELRQEMLQEGALRLLRTERSRDLEGETENPDGYRFQILVNRARSEFDRDRRRHRNDTEVVKGYQRDDDRLIHVDHVADYTEDPVDILRAAAVEGGPIDELLVERPRNIHGPRLLGHLRDALDACLVEETRRVAEMERSGAFADDRTKDGSAALNRIVWAAANLRDPAEYPSDDVNTEHRAMKRVRRFVEEFVLPSIGAAGPSVVTAA